MPVSSDDVLIIGGGIIGLAIGHALAEKGTRVRIIERYLPGTGESTRTGGGIRLSHGSAINIALTRESLPVWQRFESRLGIDPLFRQTGHLFLTSNPSHLRALREQAVWQESQGVTSDILDKGDITSQWPHLSEIPFAAGSHCATGGYLDHHRVIHAYTRAFEAHGGTIECGVRVEDLVGDGERITGVVTSKGTYSAKHVVNAAGPGAGRIAAMAGLSIPFVSRRHELIIVRPDFPVPDDTPWLIDLDAQVHMRPDGDGRALVGGFLGRDEPCDPSDYERTLSPEWTDRVLEVASTSFGLVAADCPVVDGWAGLYPGTRDYQPVLECSYPGLITAAGFAGTGLMHAPAVAGIVRDLINGDTTDLIDLDALASSRFEHQDEIMETTGF